jgi:exonuclease SbcC
MDSTDALGESLDLVTVPGDGFVIEEIEMKGFMRYVDRAVLRFPQKFTVITGSTGTGKTTILDAVTFALFKATSRTDLQTVTMSDICRPGGYAKVAFRQGGHRYEVRRGLSPKGAAYVEFLEDGEEIPGSIHEVDQAIQDMIGLDYRGFLNSTFVRQEEMKELGRATAATRLGIFQKLFRLETFRKAHDRAKAELDRVSREVENRDTELRTRKEALEELPQLQAMAEAAERELGSTKERLGVLEAKLAEQKRCVEELEAGHEEYVRTANSLEAASRRLGELEGRVARAREELESVSALKGRIARLTEETADHDERLEEGEKLRRMQQEHALASKDVETAKERLRDIDERWRRKEESLRSRVREEEERIASLGTALGAEESFGLLRREGALGERIERIAKEMTWLVGREKIIAQITEELSETERELQTVTAQTAKITPDAFALDEIRSNVQKLREDLAREKEAYERELADARVVALEAEERLSGVGFGDEERSRIAELRDAITVMKRKREELEEARRALDEAGDPSKLLHELASQKESLEAEKKALAEKLEDLKVAEVEYATAKERLEKIRAEVEDLRVEISRLETEVKVGRERIEDLREKEKRIAEVEKETAALRSEAEVLAILKDGVFHRRGVVMYAVNQLLPELQAETSRNLRDLTDGRFSRVKLETVEENRTHGIRIAAEGVDGEWHDVAEFSGGERTQINAALRFAIAKELASMPQVGRTYGRMKTLFIDEGDLGSLDTDVSRELFVHKLLKMGEFFEHIVLITHLPDVADKFDGRVRVSMTPEGESRIEVMQ